MLRVDYSKKKYKKTNDKQNHEVQWPWPMHVCFLPSILTLDFFISFQWWFIQEHPVHGGSTTASAEDGCSLLEGQLSSSLIHDPWLRREGPTVERPVFGQDGGTGMVREFQSVGSGIMTVNVILEQVLIINIHTGRCLWAALYCHVFVSVFISWQINRRTLFLFFFPDGSWRTGKRRIDRVFLWPKKLATDIGTWHFKIGRSNGENNTKNSRCGPTYCMSLFHFFSLSDERIN